MATLISEQQWWKTRKMQQAVSRSSVWTTPSRRHSLRGPKWATASQPASTSKYEDQDVDTHPSHTENEETCQETPQRTVITLPMYWFTREKVKGSGEAPTHMANSQMLAGISLVEEEEVNCRWMEQEVENRSRNRLKLDGKVLGYVAWKKDWLHHHKEVYPSLLWST